MTCVRRTILLAAGTAAIGLAVAGALAVGAEAAAKAMVMALLGGWFLTLILNLLRPRAAHRTAP